VVLISQFPTRSNRVSPFSSFAFEAHRQLCQLPLKGFVFGPDSLLLILLNCCRIQNGHITFDFLPRTIVNQVCKVRKTHMN
jgi:hypothetical protein